MVTMKNLIIVLLVLNFIGCINMARKKKTTEIEHYENGQIKEIRKYLNGKRDGLWIGFYENGDTMYYQTYKDGLENGDDVFYYRKGGGSKKRYKYEKVIGETKYWYKNGQLSFQATYDSIFEGFHGNYITWYQNGNVEMEGQYYHGNEVGNWNFYDSTGILIMTVIKPDTIAYGIYKLHKLYPVYDTIFYNSE
jgi:antitoxin component YwqK of YwqJK toxin-antitoxin module